MPAPTVSLYESTRQTCKDVLQAAGDDVKINEEAIRTWADALHADQKWELQEPHTLPFRFEDFDRELNFIAVRNLLHFGSGFDPELLQATGKSCGDTILFGIISMHLSGRALDAASFLHLALPDVESIFSIPAIREVPTHMAGVTTTAPTLLRAFSERILATLRETAQVLRARGMQRLSQFVLHLLKDGPMSSSEFVRALAETFPAFSDSPSAGVSGTAVPFHGKAVFFAHELHARFRERYPNFGFSDIADMTASVNTRTVAVLHRLGMLAISPALLEQYTAASTTSTPTDTVLRAAALLACDALATAVNARTSWGVGSRAVEQYLHQQSYEEPLRDCHVVLRTDTVAF